LHFAFCIFFFFNLCFFVTGWSESLSYTLGQLQSLIRDQFGAKDASRGMEGTFMWFMEEIGELAGALRSGSSQELALEFADVLAWLATLANIAGVDLDSAVEAKYGKGCPKCNQTPCVCVAAKP
jgi:NTP pyrophosphatase (non-canonical NTP hydrolase)